MSKSTQSIRHIDWREALQAAGSQLREDDRRVLELLAEGKSTPEIARLLGSNRSAIWRQVLRLRAFAAK
jgi:DNA-binding CsgD family transcriptional regulator